MNIMGRCVEFDIMGRCVELNIMGRCIVVFYVEYYGEVCRV